VGVDSRPRDLHFLPFPLPPRIPSIPPIGAIGAIGAIDPIAANANSR